MGRCGLVRGGSVRSGPSQDSVKLRSGQKASRIRRCWSAAHGLAPAKVGGQVRRHGKAELVDQSSPRSAGSLGVVVPLCKQARRRRDHFKRVDHRAAREAYFS